MPFVSSKKLNEMKESADALLKSLEELKQRSYLIGIERNGRVNKFTFVRGTEMHQIETMGLISDDLPGWKKKLLR